MKIRTLGASRPWLDALGGRRPHFDRALIQGLLCRRACAGGHAAGAAHAALPCPSPAQRAVVAEAPCQAGHCIDATLHGFALSAPLHASD